MQKTKTSKFTFLGIVLFSLAAQSYVLADPAPTVSAPKIDPVAMKLLERVESKLQSLHSLSAINTRINLYPPDWIHNYQRQFGTQTNIRLLRPNYALCDDYTMHLDKTTSKWENEPIEMTFDSDGGSNWRWFGYGNSYDKSVDDKKGTNVNIDCMQLNGFFDPKGGWAQIVHDSVKDKTLISLTSGENQTLNGADYKTVVYQCFVDYPFGKETLAHTPGGRMQETQTLYVGSDEIIHRVDSAYSVGWTNTDTLINLKINEPEKPASFAFNLPKGATPTSDRKESSVLANGSDVPDFTVEDPNGKPIHLSDYKGKVVVLDFWATWCGPCQQSMPGTNKVAEQFIDKNVAFLAVNTSDTEDAFKNWLPQHKDYNALTFMIDPADPSKNIATTIFKVSGIPTQFVIDTAGKVAWSQIGYDPSTDGLVKAITAAGGG